MIPARPVVRRRRGACTASFAGSLAAAVVAVAAAVLAPLPCRAGGFDTDGATAVDDATLDAARGGFDLGGGLVMSLGIERTVSVNGVVQSATALNIADMSRLGSEQAGQVAASLGALSLVQNGAGNTLISAPLAQAMGATVVQNSLNDQLLRTQTVISSTLNSAALLKTMNFQGSLLDALSGGLGIK